MLPLILLSLPLIPQAAAWGDLGHETIAYIAQNFVNSETKSWAQKILADTSSSYLANVATWADSYRYTTEGKFSEPYHFIDAEDNPPSSCNVNFDRDCGDTGCSVSAITNYTSRVQSTSLSSTQINYALRFIVHFVGDITQPLHDEAYELGANDVDVTFNGDKTNLHATWDTSMPEELVGGYSLSDAQKWANELTAEINNGSFASEKSSWLSGLNVNEAQSTAMLWAQDANNFVCSVVMPNGARVLESGDLYPKYYDSAISTVELQIAKAGYRLAAWLDAIVANKSKKRSIERREGWVRVEREVSDEELLPQPVVKRSVARLRREAVGFGCNHQH